MTSIPVSALPPGADGIRRDRWGRYLVVPKPGAPPEGYTRVTTVAKTLDDGGGLAPWKATLAICGTLARRGLRSQWEALIATTDGDPWYAGQHSKAECKRLVEECASAGGADERRDTGTSLHTLTALIDLGRAPTHVTDETAQDLHAYVTALANAGVVIVPGQVEVTVVLDRWKVAGTFDRLVDMPGFDRPLVADLKCGADLSYSWQSIAVQLAAYSRGDAVYRQGPAEDGSQDERLPMPDVDPDNGLVIWLNAGTGQCELYLVDLGAGWEAFEQSMWTRGWRRREVARRADEGARWVPATPDDELVPVLEASLPTPGPLASAPARVMAERADFTAELRAWLQGRIDAIGDHAGARADLAVSWPAGVPPLRVYAEHTPEDLRAIEDVLSAVERRHVLPFPPPRPETDAVGLVLHMFPNSTDITKEQTP